VLRRFDVEAPRWALGQPSAKGLHRSADVVYQLRARTYQRFARADDGQVSLGVLTAVLEWVEQFRIKTCEASEILSVYLVGFALVCVDKSRLARVGHQDLVAAFFEHPANPGGVSACLYGYAQRPL
jgi:hypothetical protein